MRATAAAFLVATVAAFALYAWGSAPTVFHGDSAEMQIVASVGGIPHATGYPGFVLAGRALSWIGGADPGRRVTLMNAAFAALSVGLVVVVLRVLGLSIGSALVAAGLYALSFTFWRGAQRAEVYAISVLLALLALWRCLIAFRSQRYGDALVAALLLGLVTTGHLAFAVFVMALGLLLAWRTFRARPGALRLVGLVMAFAIGLTPYLYLVWRDTQPGGFNTLQLTDSVINPLGRPMPGFDSPWERVEWLVMGMNRYGGGGTLSLEPFVLARSLFYALATVFLFELGPFAVVLVLAGAWFGVRRFGRRALVAAIVIAAVTLYGAALGRGEFLGIILIPCTLMLALVAGLGIEWFREHLAGFGRLGAAAGIPAAIAAIALLALPPHALRVYAARHPIGRLQMLEEGDLHETPPGLIPSLRGEREPRRIGEATLDAAPRDALVVAYFKEYTNLLYLQLVEKRRTDVTIQIMSPEGLPERLDLWSRAHPASPIVFATRPPDWIARGGIDSLRTASGTWIYRKR